MIEKPLLRFLDAIPVRQGEDVVVVLRDPEELSGQDLAVPLPMFLIMTLFDGTRDARDVQAEVQRQFQQIIPIEQIERMIQELDQFYLLDNERALIRREDMERAFKRLDVRPAAHAGMAYPDDPQELIKTFDSYMEQARNGDSNGSTPLNAPRGLVTPHIDLRRGGRCMAHAFRQLNVDAPPSLYIILGVAHHPTPNLYTLTIKDFDTPLGAALVHKPAAERLSALYGSDRLAGDYAHRLEHSVEFQAVFLRYLHHGRHEFKILPILCGSMHEDLEKGNGPPITRPEVREFCAALQGIIEEFGPGVCVIAGVDLSHVGKKFGDTQGVDDFRAGLVRAADMRMLDLVRDRNPEEFFNHFRPDQNARNVDAVAAVYTMLNVLGPGGGELLHYDQYASGKRNRWFHSPR